MMSADAPDPTSDPSTQRQSVNSLERFGFGSVDGNVTTYLITAQKHREFQNFVASSGIPHRERAKNEVIQLCDRVVAERLEDQKTPLFESFRSDGGRWAVRIGKHAPDSPDDALRFFYVITYIRQLTQT